LINQIAAFSLTKTFGKAETKTAKLDPVPDFPKVDESLTTQDYNKDLKELEELRNLNKKIKAQNEQLKAENEKLKLLSAKTLKENEASKQLIVELLKENEKIKLAKEIFKKEILENQNKEILKKIEEEVSKPVINKFRLLMFLLVLVSIIFTFGFLITRISIKLFKI